MLGEVISPSMLSLSFETVRTLALILGAPNVDHGVGRLVSCCYKRGCYCKQNRGEYHNHFALHCGFTLPF